ATDQLDKGILERGLALLHSADLAAGSLDHPHHAPQRGIVRELKTEPVEAVLLGDARRGYAFDRAQSVEQAAARAELEVDDRILLESAEPRRSAASLSPSRSRSSPILRFDGALGMP